MSRTKAKVAGERGSAGQHQAVPEPVERGAAMKKAWQTKTLGEIGKVSMCKRIFKEETTATGDIPFYKIGTFGKEPDAFIPNQTYNEYRAKYPFPKKGDVLISASGTIGRRVRYGGEPAYFQDSNIVWIDNDEKQVLNDYLYHFYGACEWNSTSECTHAERRIIQSVHLLPNADRNISAQSHPRFRTSHATDYQQIKVECAVRLASTEGRRAKEDCRQVRRAR